MLFGLFETARDRRQLQLMEEMTNVLKRIDQKLDQRSYGHRNQGNGSRNEKPKRDWRRERDEQARIDRHYQNKFSD